MPRKHFKFLIRHNFWQDSCEHKIKELTNGTCVWYQKILFGRIFHVGLVNSFGRKAIHTVNRKMENDDEPFPQFSLFVFMLCSHIIFYMYEKCLPSPFHSCMKNKWIFLIISREKLSLEKYLKGWYRWSMKVVKRKILHNFKVCFKVVRKLKRKFLIFWTFTLTKSCLL